MEMLPIQVTEAGVLIPRQYLRGARLFDFVLEGDYVLVKPISPKNAPRALKRLNKNHRYTFIASGKSRNPTASTQVEEVLLLEGMSRKSGEPKS
jgi:hypothetical protein